MKFSQRHILLRIGLFGVILLLTALIVPIRPSSAQDAMHTPTDTRTPTLTRTPRPSKTPTNTPTPQPSMVILGTYSTPVNTPVTPIPPPAPTPVSSGDDVVTVMLLGSDNLTPGIVSGTDTDILLSIDRTTGTASMISLSYDIFVYAPNHTMLKLDEVWVTGEKDGPDGGANLMKATMLYNFGIKVDFYAHVNFYAFQQIIAQLGGLNISVDCAIQGHRLKSPSLDAFKADSYELYTLPIGWDHLNPYMALWYVRSRGSSSDIDRGRREMEVLRAIWQQAKGAGLLSQVVGLWPQAQKLVQTDLSLQDVLGLVPFALNLDPSNIQRIVVPLNAGFTIWYTPDKGEYTLLMNSDVWRKAIQDFATPPSANRLSGESPTVAIAAAPLSAGYDRVAADDLAWAGFSTQLIGSQGLTNRDATILYDYTGNAKPSSRQALIQTLRIAKSNVIDQPDPNRSVDFRVEMGKDYGKSCLYALPKEYQDVIPTAHP